MSGPLTEKTVAFASWRCNCTILAVTKEEIPTLCPTHQKGLLGPIEWVVNKKNVALDLKPDHRRSA